MEEIKTINIDDLKKRFIELNQNLESTHTNVNKIQNTLVQEQTRIQQILGAMQNVGEMMSSLIGNDEAQKFISEIQRPK